MSVTEALRGSPSALGTYALTYLVEGRNKAAIRGASNVARGATFHIALPLRRSKVLTVGESEGLMLSCPVLGSGADK